jgi:hypothetical protein
MKVHSSKKVEGPLSAIGLASFGFSRVKHSSETLEVLSGFPRRTLVVLVTLSSKKCNNVRQESTRTSAQLCSWY